MNLNHNPTPLELIEGGIRKLERALQEANQSVKEIKGTLAQIEGKQEPPHRGNKETYTVKASENYDVEFTKVITFSLKGSKYKVHRNAWNHCVIHLCKILNGADSNKFRSVLWDGECVKWFNTSPKGRNWVALDRTNVYFHDAIPAPDAQKVAVELVTRFGYEKEHLVFELRDTPRRYAKKERNNNG